jgi:hypothetical protein
LNAYGNTWPMPNVIPGKDVLRPSINKVKMLSES